MILLRQFCAVIPAVLLSIVWLQGNNAACGAPAYKALRYDEDYSYLREPGARSDIWDPLKFIRLDLQSGSYLTLGGEIRQRYEYHRNARWVQGAQDDNGYLLQRYMLHADVHLGAGFRIFAQTRGAYESGRNGGPRATDEDQLDLTQAFFDVAWRPAEEATFTVRVGRQEVGLGSSRLVSFRESPNLRRSFEGVRGIIERGGVRIDLLALEVVEVRDGTFNDRADSGQRL